jgi:predicted DNA-binding transcriptional regulator YafY
VELAEPRHLAATRSAVDEGAQIEVEYLGVGRDAPATRVVDPIGLASFDGEWYLDGYCHRAEGMRRFRVDRILELRRSGRPACHGGPGPDEAPAGAPFVPGADATVAEVVVDRAGGWLAESVPVLSTGALDDGRLVVRLAVVNPDWFAGVLLQLGPHARVVAPPELAEAGRALAGATLARYTGVHEKD